MATYGPLNLIRRSTPVILTDAQIKALPVTPVELVAAPGAGKVLLFLRAHGLLDTSAGAYVIPGTDTWTVIANSADGNDKASNYRNLKAELTGTVASHVGWTPKLDQGTDAFVGYMLEAGIITANAPLVIYDQSFAAAYTGGHASNTLRCTVLYAVVDVS